jgi:hypothetical protein
MHMIISRFALTACIVAVLSLFGLTQTGRGAVNSTSPLIASTSYASSNGLHVQLMREASRAYVVHQNPVGHVQDRMPEPVVHNDASQY